MAEQEIIMYATEWCGDCKRSRRLLDKLNISYKVIDIDQDKTGNQFVRNINKGNASVPTIVFPNGIILVEPSDEELIKSKKLVSRNN